MEIKKESKDYKWQQVCNFFFFGFAGVCPGGLVTCLWFNTIFTTKNKKDDPRT